MDYGRVKRARLFVSLFFPEISNVMGFLFPFLEANLVSQVLFVL